MKDRAALHLFGGRAQQLEDVEQLLQLAVRREEWVLHKHQASAQAQLSRRLIIQKRRAPFHLQLYEVVKRMVAVAEQH